MSAVVAMRVCGKCGDPKPEVEFRQNARRTVFVDDEDHCRRCRKNVSVLRSYHRHRERKMHEMRERRANATPERRAARKAYGDAHYAANREQYAESHRGWRERNRDDRNAYMRRYFRERCERDPTFAARLRELSRQTTKTRDARKRGQFVEHVKAQVVWERDEGICGICGESIETPAEFHVDHVIPLSLGGEHSYANVQAAHARCNLRKGGRSQ